MVVLSQWGLFKNWHLIKHVVHNSWKVENLIKWNRIREQKNSPKSPLALNFVVGLCGISSVHTEAPCLTTHGKVWLIFLMNVHIFWNMTKKSHFRAFNGSNIVSIWHILVKLGCIRFFTFINTIGMVKKEWKRVKKSEKHEKS